MLTPAFLTAPALNVTSHKFPCCQVQSTQRQLQNASCKAPAAKHPLQAKCQVRKCLPPAGKGGRVGSVGRQYHPAPAHTPCIHPSPGAKKEQKRKPSGSPRGQHPAGGANKRPNLEMQSPTAVDSTDAASMMPTKHGRRRSNRQVLTTKSYPSYHLRYDILVNNPRCFGFGGNMLLDMLACKVQSRRNIRYEYRTLPGHTGHKPPLPKAS